MLPLLTSYLQENWQTFFGPGRNPEKISYLGIWGSLEGGKVSFMGFADNDKIPSFIVKILRNNDKLDQFINEADTLIELESKNVGNKYFFPHVILCQEFEGIWVLLESVLLGYSMAVRMTSSGKPNIENSRRDFGKIEEFLRDLHHETADSHYFNEGVLKDKIITPVEKLRQLIELSPYEAELLTDTISLIKGFCGLKIKLSMTHGDFCRQNLIVLRNGLGIIDWEFGEKDNFCLYDLFNFAAHYYLQATEENALDYLIKIFFEDNNYSELVNRTISKLIVDLEIPGQVVEPLFTMFVIDKALKEYNNLINLSARGYLPIARDCNNKSYNDKIKVQLWVSLLKYLAINRGKLIFKKLAIT